MDYDRKSTVSSFYGGRRSGDALALNADFPAGAAPPARPRVESTSSFYGDRNSRADVYDNGPVGAGYNQNSFTAAGRTEPVKGGGDEEAAWDIYADFNNAGPKYSSAFGMGDTGSYRQVPSPTPYSPQTAGFAKQSAASLTGEQQPGGVEMVTVPALGPEWKADELHDMSKKAKREEKMENMSSKWKAWNRGQTGLCGRHFTRRFTAWLIFGLCAAIGLVLAFTIPRVPAFSTNQIEPISSATAPFNKTVPTEFSRLPTNFSFPGMMKLQADTGGNFLPLTFNNIHATVFDLTTNRQVGSGDTGHLTVPAKQFPVVNLNLNFTYSAVNDSDITWNNWYNACKNKAVVAGGVRPSVQFRLLLELDIAGLIGKQGASTQVTDGACPIELPTNSV